MQKYKGYYIDHVYFNSKKDIDEHCKKQAIDHFIKLNRLFANKASMELSIECSESARFLHQEYGLSYEEIEALETEAVMQVVKEG